jgi:hypothetical protein
MNVHVTDTGDIRVVDLDTGAALAADVADRKFSLHEFAFLELRAARAYLLRRCQIAQVKEQHGLLTAEEQDALALKVAELMADIELWRQYK